MVTQDEYKQRRKRLCESIGADAVAIIPAAKEKLRNGDAHYLFRQNSDFYYLTGFNEPDAVVVLAPGMPDANYILFNLPKDPKKEIWDGLRAGQEGACKDYLADQAYPIDELETHLKKLLLHCNNVYYPLGQSEQIDSLIKKVIEQLRSEVRAGVDAPHDFHDVLPLIHEMRLFKSDSEIELMQTAASIAARAHCNAMQRAKPGLFEYNLEAELIYSFCDAGARAPAYNSIIGSGANGCILHYVENQAELNDGDLILIDAGAEYACYASDVTRTFPVNGKYTEEQAAIYNLVLKSQLAAIDLIRPGVIWNELQETIVDILTRGLVDLGILTGDVNELLAKQAYNKYYMHNSGHWLGLDVHDAGVYKIENKWRQLEPGMVLTVEPGLYLAANDELDPKWWNIGIRIEDDVLVTETGSKVLSQAVPKTISEIESLMQG